MANLILYGSLVNKNEIKGEGSRFRDRRAVRVAGFQRIFNLPTTFKKTIKDCKSVLNVVPSTAHWFNGVLMAGIDETSLAGLDRREDGYTREKVAREMVAPLIDGELPPGPIYLYVGEPHRIDETILPIPDYLQICLAGARQWGDVFYHGFLQTTYVRGRRQLAEYLRGLDEKT